MGYQRRVHGEKGAAQTMAFAPDSKMRAMWPSRNRAFGFLLVCALVLYFLSYHGSGSASTPPTSFPDEEDSPTVPVQGGIVTRKILPPFLSSLPATTRNTNHGICARLGERTDAKQTQFTLSNDDVDAGGMYYKGFPSKQAAIDLFNDLAHTRWYQLIPGFKTVGYAGLYNDSRVKFLDLVFPGDA